MPFHTSRHDHADRRAARADGRSSAAATSPPSSRTSSPPSARTVTVIARGAALLRGQDDDGLRAVHRARRATGGDVRLRRRAGRGCRGDGARSCSTSTDGAVAARSTCCWSPPAACPTPTGSTCRAGGVATPRRRPGRGRRVPADRPPTASGRSATSSSDYQLKHVANHEARVVAHNLRTRTTCDRVRPPLRAARPCSPSRRSPRSGLTEQQAGAAGLRYVDRGAGLRRHRLRLGDGGHHRLLQGARRPGHRPAARRAHHRAAGSTLIQPLIQAMSLRARRTRMAAASTGSTRR